MATHFTLLAASVAIGLFLAFLVMMALGRRLGRRRPGLDQEGGRDGLGGAEGAVYGLLGLLIAFTFSGAAERFEKRRALVIDEANAIGTAYLRLDVLPTEAQSPLRDAFRNYLDSRLEAYRKLPDLAAAEKELARSVRLQGELWRSAVAVTQLPGGSSAQRLLLPALNEMFDLASTRSAMAGAHPPVVIFALLVALALLSAFMIGFGMAANQGRSGLHSFAYAAVLATVIYVIIDLEFPRLGLIRVDAIDQVLADVRQGMK